jgi:hypothetical protein
MPHSYQLARAFHPCFEDAYRVLPAGEPSQPPVVNGSAGASRDRSAGDDRSLSLLAAKLRGEVAPVIGYLELIADDGTETLSQQQLQWVGTIERRLESLRALSDELTRACAELRRSINAGPGASAPDPAGHWG